MADLIGTQGSITFSGSDGPTVTDVVQWRGVITDRKKSVTTRPGYLMERYSYGPIRGSGTLLVVVSDSVVTMPIPTGTQATLTLLETSGQSYAGSAALTFLRKVSVSSIEGTQQYAEYGWEWNASTAAGLTVV